MLTTQEATELAAALADVTEPITVADACDVLADAMDTHETVEADRKAKGASLRLQLAELERPFREHAAAAASLIDVVKLRIALAVEEADATAAVQIAARTAVDAPFQAPKGVTIKRDLVIAIADVAGLDPDFTKPAPDMDLIHEAVTAGMSVRGADVSTEIKVQLNRKHYGAVS